MDFLAIIILIIILLFSVIFHEIAHGGMAYILGDPTAKNAGRLTLNPIKHIDPVGTIFLPLMLLILTMGRGPIFGWAKPVPINPFNFSDKKYGPAKVAVAGPLANISLALIFGLFLRFGSAILPLQTSLFFLYVVQINLILAIFNLLPIPPLDGSHILFAFLSTTREVRLFLAQYGIFILIFIIFFFGRYIFSLVEFLTKLIVAY
jgi:Zn-dependent protease